MTIRSRRHIQHALVQIGERMSRRDASVTRWYPDVVRLLRIRWKKFATPRPG